MKSYPSINGCSKAPHSPCVAFYKYDGSNLRFEWSKQRGFHKFGTRRRLFDESDPEYGKSIQLFQDKYADKITAALLKDKKYGRQLDRYVAFCEYFGPSSFAGQHKFEENMDIVLFDIAIHNKGFLTPREFIDVTENIDAAQVVYDGNLNAEFIQKVKTNSLDVKLNEGVVVKGIHPRAKNPNHAIWMVKIKTKEWMDKLKDYSLHNPSLMEELVDNEREQ